MNIILTTLLILLYPPLKGFSHSLDHVRIRDKPLPKDPPRGSLLKIALLAVIKGCIC